MCCSVAAVSAHWPTGYVKNTCEISRLSGRPTVYTVLTLTSVGLEPFLSRMRMRLASLMALVSDGKINFFSGDAVIVVSGSASVVCKQRGQTFTESSK